MFTQERERGKDGKVMTDMFPFLSFVLTGSLALFIHAIRRRIKGWPLSRERNRRGEEKKGVTVENSGGEVCGRLLPSFLFSSVRL